MIYPKFSLAPIRNGLIGHRGIAALAPENTMASFKLASQQGIEWVEFDLRLTKDDQLIIFHDDTLERTTDGIGRVEEKSLLELSQLDAGKWFNPTFKGEKIPIFQEVLSELIDLKLNLNIELKMPADGTVLHAHTLADRFVEIMTSEWPKHLPLPLVSSFNWSLVTRVRAKLPELPIGFLHDNCTVEMIELVADTTNSALHCHFESITPVVMDIAKGYGVPIIVYTVNDPIKAKQLLNAGIFAVISDDPAFLIKKGSYRA